MISGLEIFSDLSERLNYNIPNFPLYVHKGTLYQFDRYAAACHYHPDLEFILVQDGEMDYFVNGQIVHIGTGNGIFINSKRMHYGFSNDRTDCSYIVAAVHPVLLGAGTLAGKAYLEETFGLDTDNFLLLTPQISWQRDALLLLTQIYDEMHSDTNNLLHLLSLAVTLCDCVGDHIQQISGHSSDEQSWMVLRKMTGYIHQHYDLKITIDEIAAAGTVCRSRCCELFNKYIGQTPNNYLIQYRILKSREMLRETSIPICEIAIACGFQTASYFSYVFRKETGLVPQDFRKQAAFPVPQ
ncbi:AraC family transcriptional regulator [Lachnospiraceae bacterium 54-53]